MRKISTTLFLVMTSTLLTSCATFTKPGMTFSEVEESIAGTCSLPLSTKNFLYFRSAHEVLPDIKIYVVKYPNNFDEDCRKIYYFKNDVLLSDKELVKLIQERKEQDAFNARQEELRIDRIREEERNRINALLEVSNSYMSKNNAKVIYTEGTFVIGQKTDGTFLYHKDGSTKNPNEVQQEIEGYKGFLIYQKELEILRQKNLSRTWLVTATGNRGCFITKVYESYRNQDGSSVFHISYGCRGSSGATSITCGYNQSNKKESTAVIARCN